MKTKVHEYLLSKVPYRYRKKICVDDNGCWLWSGEINRNGYGRLWINGKRVMAHRYIYELLKTVIDEGFVLDHLCCARSCCNPAHLSPVTVKQNTYRGKARLFIRVS